MTTSWLDQPDLYHVGFTGTRDGMTQDQATLVQALFLQIQVERKNESHWYALHHGACPVGPSPADAQAHAIAVSLGWSVILHPMTGGYRHDLYPNPSVILRPLPPLERDTVIAEASAVLVAAPKQAVEIARSGTWATVRRAREQGRRRPIEVMVVRPDGSMRLERHDGAGHCTVEESAPWRQT